ncbi:MAG: hypothetical protein ACYS9X_30330, partial [Planctomycetota bacterium]
NDGGAPVEYGAHEPWDGDRYAVRGPDGEPYFNQELRTSGDWMSRSIEPRGTAVLNQCVNVAWLYHVVTPGRYTVRFRGTHTFPPSNTVEFDVKPGEPTKEDRLFGVLLPIVPEGRRLSKFGWRGLVGGELVMYPSGRGPAPGSCFVFHCHPKSGLKKDYAYVHVWVTERAVEPTERALARGDVVSDHLGETGLGHFYMTARDKAAALWPEAREQVRAALGIR